MSLQLFTDYPSWFWLLCILCGALYAAALYYSERKINSALSSNVAKAGLAAARTTAVTIIAFLLLNPYLKSQKNETYKPIVIIVQDNSSSIKQNLADSAAYINSIQNLRNELEENYEVTAYTFGDNLNDEFNISFSDKSTDLSSALTEKSERFIAAEVVREKIMKNYRQEIPYSVEVNVDEYKDRGELIKIRAIIFVARQTQKSIIIGNKGEAIKKIGIEARKDLESFTGKKIFLELFVKVKENWKDDANKLRELGYD